MFFHLFPHLTFLFFLFLEIVSFFAEILKLKTLSNPLFSTTSYKNNFKKYKKKFGFVLTNEGGLGSSKPWNPFF